MYSRRRSNVNIDHDLRGVWPSKKNKQGVGRRHALLLAAPHFLIPVLQGLTALSAQMFWEIPSGPIISRESVILVKLTWSGYHSFLWQRDGMLKTFRGMSLFGEIPLKKLFKLDLRAEQVWGQAWRDLTPMQKQDSFSYREQGKRRGKTEEGWIETAINSFRMKDTD